MNDAPAITFADDRMQVRFNRFGLPAYSLFLKCKALPESACEFDPSDESYTLSAPARFAEMLGVTRPAVRDVHPLADFLFDDQRELVRLALECKRFALWCQCGWGKTPSGIEWARQVVLRTGGRVLITTINDIVGEWIREAAKFYGDSLKLHRIASRADMREWMQHGEPGIAITNYEKWNPDGLADQIVNEARFLAGAVVDENRLKTGGGKQKWALGKSMKGIEYKLTLTATPAPNDTMEFASQAMWLEKMRTEQDIIWTFFTRDQKTHRWAVKPHARAAFFEFMSSWSVYVNDPKRYGWRLGQPDVPKPDYRIVEISATPEQLDLARTAAANVQTGQMSLVPPNETNVIQRLKLSQIAKGFRYRKAVNVPGAGGLQFVGEFVIPKNPQQAAQRLNLHSLQFKTGYARNGCMLAPFVNDYVLIFQKPGQHPCPPKPLYHKSQNPNGWVTTEEWVRDAGGIWSDINEIDVLDGARGHKEETHEKHVCPLQLEVIRRCVRLYTNPLSVQPDVTVLDPFMGIGSTAYVCAGGVSPMTKLALEEPRNAVGFELKDSYYRASLDYVGKAKKAIDKPKESTLFEAA